MTTATLLLLLMSMILDAVHKHLPIGVKGLRQKL